MTQIAVGTPIHPAGWLRLVSKTPSREPHAMTAALSSIASPAAGQARNREIEPAVTVVVPTRGQSQVLVDVLKALDTQAGIARSAMEVVVVLDGAGADAATRLRARAWSVRLRILEILRSGTGAARDVGWRAAHAPLILFLDDNVVPAACLVSEHLAAQESRGPCVVLGRVQQPQGRVTPWTAYDHHVMAKKCARLDRVEVPSGIHYGGNVSMPRDLLAKVGGHDHVLQHDADVELGDRLRARGAAFAYCPSAVGVHRGTSDYRTWRRSYFLHGRWDVALRRDRGLSGGLDGLLACYYDRHPLNRLAVRVGMGRRTVDEGGLADAAATVGSLAYRLRLDGVCYAAYSCAANILYWSGVRDAMRGSAAFWKAVRSLRHHRGRPYVAATIWEP